ncbi:hypothetical protein BDK51DRAFT_26836, partial [Blyttiomyces helicus]
MTSSSRATVGGQLCHESVISLANILLPIRELMVDGGTGLLLHPMREKHLHVCFQIRKERWNAIPRFLSARASTYDQQTRWAGRFGGLKKARQAKRKSSDPIRIRSDPTRSESDPNGSDPTKKSMLSVEIAVGEALASKCSKLPVLCGGEGFLVLRPGVATGDRHGDDSKVGDISESVIVDGRIGYAVVRRMQVHLQSKPSKLRPVSLSWRLQVDGEDAVLDGKLAVKLFSEPLGDTDSKGMIPYSNSSERWVGSHLRRSAYRFELEPPVGRSRPPRDRHIIRATNKSVKGDRRGWEHEDFQGGLL